MASNGLRIAIACEDQAHRALACVLTDEVLLSEALAKDAHWVDREALSWLRTFCGRSDSDDKPEHLRFYSLKDAREDVAALGHRATIGGRPVRDRGFIHGRPLEPEARLWRRILILFAQEQPRPDALILVRDTDGVPSRLEGLRQALELMNDFPEPWPVIVALPHQDAEAWFVAGFVPRDASEQKRLAELKNELSFSPPDEPHRLTAHPNHAPSDAKRVLRLLAFDQDESRPPGLEELPELSERTLKDLPLLEKRGAACNLAAFIQELRRKLVPLLLGNATAPAP